MSLQNQFKDSLIIHEENTKEINVNECLYI